MNLTTLERQAITPLPAERLKRGERERWNWNPPIVMSSFDPKVVYIGSNLVFRSADRGATWKAISPDLTAHMDREQLQMMGAPVAERALSRHDGQTSFSTLTTIGESPLDANILYTGSDDGQVYGTREGGRKWTNLSERITGLPPRTYVSSVLPSAHVAGRVYATFDGHYNDDHRAYVYVSDDFGHTWRSIGAGLPQTSVHRLREHPRQGRLLFAGHERGVHVSIDGGDTWSSLNLNMPNVPVDDLLIHARDNDLIAGTHGRSIWVLDNIAPLEALAGEAMSGDAYLVAPARARLLSIYSPQAWFGGGQFFAPNPDFGATIDYYLRTASPEPVQITVSDTNNQIVRTLTFPARRGLNRVSWDLRLEPPLTDATRQTSPAGAAASPPLGPLVVPGTCMVSMRGGTATTALKAPLRVEAEPRVSFSDGDRRARQTVLLNLYELQKTLVAARTTARAAESQVDALRKDGKALASDGGRMTQIQNDIGSQLNVSAGLSRAIEGYSGMPTADQRRQIDWVFEDAAKTLGHLNRVLRSDGLSSAPELTLPKR